MMPAEQTSCRWSALESSRRNRRTFLRQPAIALDPVAHHRIDDGAYEEAEHDVVDT